MAFLQELDHRNNQLLTGAPLVVSTTTKKTKKFVSTLIFRLERRVKLKVDEVELLLRHLYGYNSASFLKPATALGLPGRMN